MTYNKTEKLLELAVLGRLIGEYFIGKFPNGHIEHSSRIGLGGSPALNVSLGLIGDLKDCSNAIRHNDPMHHHFTIYAEDNGDLESNKFISGLYVNPPKGSYLAMEAIKTKYRKTTGDSVRVLKSFKRLIDFLRILVDQERDNIYHTDDIDPKYFL